MGWPVGDDDSVLPTLKKKDDSPRQHGTISSQPHESCLSNPQLGELSLDLVKAATGQFDAQAIAKFTWCNKALAVCVLLHRTQSKTRMYVKLSPVSLCETKYVKVKINLIPKQLALFASTYWRVPLDFKHSYP
jgi:hypothetical protein